MRIATWNINSVSVRTDRLLAWLASAQPDVLCLQELKVAAEQFPVAEVEAAGYAVAAHGDGRWNGVAILSRVGLDDVTRGLPGAAGVRRRRSSRGRSARRAAACACGRCTCPTAARSTTRTTPTSSSGSASLRDTAVAELPAGAPLGRARRLQRRADRLRRLGHLEVRRLHPRDRRRSARPSTPCATPGWSRCCRARSSTTRPTPTGTTASSPSPRTPACASTSSSGRRRSATRSGDAYVDREARKPGTKGTTPPSDHAPVVVDVAL